IPKMTRKRGERVTIGPPKKTARAQISNQSGVENAASIEPLCEPKNLYASRPIAKTDDVMTLSELEVTWWGYLLSENCPPVLGLAPLSEDESDVIRQLAAA